MRLLGAVAAATIMLSGMSGACLAADPMSPAKGAVVQSDDGTKSGSSTAPLGDQLDRSNGVIMPPGGIDPGLTKAPPAAGPQSTPVIPPLGGPGGPSGVTAK